MVVAVIVTNLITLSSSSRVSCMNYAGVSNLIQQVCRLSKGLRLLNLSKTSLTSKGLGASAVPFMLSLTVNKVWSVSSTFVSADASPNRTHSSFHKATADWAALRPTSYIIAQQTQTSKAKEILCFHILTPLWQRGDLWSPLLPRRQRAPMLLSHLTSSPMENLNITLNLADALHRFTLLPLISAADVYE